jgi:hypothetical protein
VQRGAGEQPDARDLAQPLNHLIRSREGSNFPLNLKGALLKLIHITEHAGQQWA